ncbi:MAG TPA: transglutaminase family protein [Mycobacteriales bacterium]|nr:transglutaminase family protein [Mycobacteriales bacterium]
MTQRAQEQLGRPLLDPAGLDLESADRVTYVMRQRLRYDYDGSAYDLAHRLVVVPRQRHGNQRRLHHSLTVSAAAADVTTRRDRHGNLVTQVRLGVVPETVEFSLQALIERRGASTGATLPLSALSELRLLRPTKLTTPDAALQQVARELRAAAPDDLDFAEVCCAHVNGAIAYEYGPTSVSTTAAQAYAGGRGVCQDHAHVMLAICRAAGVPARYVSGHLLGEGGSHAWVEVVVRDGDRATGVAFDPCNGRRAGAGYITVATGRDYAHVAPTSGYYAGDATGRLTVTKSIGVIAAA